METDELSLIGCLILHPEMTGVIASRVSAGDLEGEASRAVFLRALEGPMETDEAANAVEAATGKKPEDARAFIRECMDLCPTRIGMDRTAERIHDRAVLLRLRREAGDALAEEGEPAALAERLARLGQDGLRGLRSGCVPLSDHLTELLRGLDTAHDGRVDTGFAKLDGLLSGLYPGQLILLGARPAVGKSALGMNIAEHAARTRPVVLFSAEMNGRELCQRLVAGTGAVPLGAFLTPGGVSEENINDVNKAACRLAEGLKLMIDDSPILTLERVAAGIAARPDTALAVVDYLGLMQAPRDREGNRNQELGELARGLKRLAGQFRVPILALAQLNRGSTERERPFLHSLRDSGELEQHADKVLLAWRPTEERVEVDVAKNRQGARGEVQFTFDGDHMRFTEADDIIRPNESAAARLRFA